MSHQYNWDDKTQYPDYSKMLQQDIAALYARDRSNGTFAAVGDAADGTVEFGTNFLEYGYALGRMDSNYRHQYNHLLSSYERPVDGRQATGLGRVAGWALAPVTYPVGAVVGALDAAWDWAFGDDEPGMPAPRPGPGAYIQPTGYGR
jgi:hypothetical protein